MRTSDKLETTTTYTTYTTTTLFECMGDRTGTTPEWDFSLFSSEKRKGKELFE
jgi:hypothetical protein